MDFTSIIVDILKAFGNIPGGYGLGIIFITVLVRLAMWPLTTSQQKSMKKMQELSPKLKEIQARYKAEPQIMQKKMMEFYKEHSFNPFGGCFPLLVQMPIFIMLYAALMSPQFAEVAGNASFLSIKLNTPIKSHAGTLGDHIFGVEKNDTFSAGKNVIVYTDKGVIQDVKIKNQQGAFDKKPKQEITPGQPVELKTNLDNLDLPANELNSVKKVDMPVINNTTREVERINFTKTDSSLIAKVPTEQAKTTFHPEVLVLVILFALTMVLSQKAMMKTSNTAAMDPAQKAMQDQMAKIMPLMITATFLFIPIPAGVLLYLVSSNIFQTIQTVVINKKIQKEEENKPKSVVNQVPSDAKAIEGKEKVSEEDNTVAQTSGNSGKKKKNKKNR